MLLEGMTTRRRVQWPRERRRRVDKDGDWEQLIWLARRGNRTRGIHDWLEPPFLRPRPNCPYQAPRVEFGAMAV